MQDVLSLAAAPARKATTGPTQFAPLRDVVTHPDFGRLCLAERVSDGERFVVTSKQTATCDPVALINERNVARHRIDARLREIADELDTDGLAEDAAAALVSEQDTLKSERDGLPRADALRAGPVAAALALYAQQDAGGE